jgi:hypothetical protein
MAKRNFFLGMAIGLMVSFCLAGDDVQRIPRVSYVDGDVSLQESGDTGWSTVDVNLPLQVNDRLVLEKEGLLEVEVDDGSFIRLNQFSELVVRRLGEGEIALELVRGELILRIRSDVNYFVPTPFGEVALTKEGLYRINVRPDESVEVLVRQGKATFVNQTIDKSVGEGKRLLVVNRGADAVAGLADRADDFDNWSERRDSRYASTNGSSRYIPREVSVGVYDLDHYGRWVYLADYGYCWAPIVYTSGWAPYRYGYWRYSAYWGWTWISYDPWGWLPYHYGRWWCSTAFGWVWIPGSYWGVDWWSPACVRFGYWNNYVGWCPLGPGDYYNYGYWNHGHHTNVHNDVSVNNYYNLVNSRHPGAVTYINVDDFRQGRPIGRGVYSRSSVDRGSLRSADNISFRGDQNVSRELFRRDNIVEGPPRVDPIRGSSATYVRSRGGVTGESDTIGSGSYRGGTVTVSNTGRSRDAGVETSRGSSTDDNYSSDRSSYYRSDSTDTSNRGRPEVSRGGVQDRSRSRQPEGPSGSAGSVDRGNSRSEPTNPSRGADNRRIDSTRGSSNRGVDSNRGSSSRSGATTTGSGTRGASPSRGSDSVSRPSSSRSSSPASGNRSTGSGTSGSGSGRERRAP